MSVFQIIIHAIAAGTVTAEQMKSGQTTRYWQKQILT
jgi:hypothetical protein